MSITHDVYLYHASYGVNKESILRGTKNVRTL